MAMKVWVLIQSLVHCPLEPLETLRSSVQHGTCCLKKGNAEEFRFPHQRQFWAGVKVGKRFVGLEDLDVYCFFVCFR